MITNLDSLLRACPLKEATLRLPGTVETILLRELTLADRAEHLERNKENPDYLRSAAWLVARSCPALTDDDIEGLISGLSLETIKYRSGEVMRLSGMLAKDAVEEEVKN